MIGTSGSEGKFFSCHLHSGRRSDSGCLLSKLTKNATFCVKARLLGYSFE
jgi:hypothetical protein